MEQNRPGMGPFENDEQDNARSEEQQGAERAVSLETEQEQDEAEDEETDYDFGSGSGGGSAGDGGAA